MKANQGSILFINRVYPPNEGATGQFLAELATHLAESGWEVTVLTTQTFPPTPQSQTVAGVKVVRIRAPGLDRVRHWKRAFGYLMIYLRLAGRALLLPRANIVVTLTDPPMLACLGALLTWFGKRRHVHWAQDLYPELAEELGALRKNGWLARALRGLSNWALKRSAKVIAIGHCMKARLLQRGLPEDSICVIPNWALNACAAPRNNGRNFRDAHGFHDRFIVMYAGNLGWAHLFDPILEAAKILQRRDARILFVFIGEGPQRAWLLKEVEVNHLDNVRLLPFQPLQNLGATLAAADIHLATLRHNLLGLLVPSKVYGIINSGNPCIFLGPPECEAAQLIARYGRGSVLASSSEQLGEVLVDCILQWVNKTLCPVAVGKRTANLQSRLFIDAALERFENVFRGGSANETR